MHTPRTPAPRVDGGDRADGGVGLESLSLTRRGRTLLDGLDVDVGPGETLAVMGPSGAGKTTLLRAIAGLAPPDSGRVVRPPRRVAMVFQEPRLLPWRSALANVALVARGPDPRARARRWLETVGLGDATHLFPAAMSGGMRQRVAIARALVCESPVMLVDEPFTGLDVDTATRVRDTLLAHLHDAPRAVVWVTHDPADAAAVAGRILRMDGPPSGAWSVVSNERIFS